MDANSRDRIKLLLTEPSVISFLDALDQLVPERTPSPGEDLRRIDQEIGRRELVRYLLRLREETEQESLT